MSSHHTGNNEKPTSLNRHVRSTDLSMASSSKKTSGSLHTKAADDAFNATMAEATRLMSVSQLLFSQIIHAKGVERISDIVGSTIGRPNAILTGAIFSFVFTLGTYLLAKNIGYSLSGFESIGAFMVGWMCGLTFDLLGLMINGKH